MNPADILVQGLLDDSLVLVKGKHDGIGDRLLDRLAEDGWLVAKVEPTVVEGEILFRIVEEARDYREEAS